MYIIGIDIAKKNHQAVITDSEGKVLGKTFRFSNSVEGFEIFISKVREVDCDFSKFEIGMEATGHYWLNLYSHLKKLDFKIHVINPLQSDALRNLYLRRTKTDSVDSKIIAQVIRIGQFSETELTDENTVVLRELSRQRFYLVDMRADFKRKVVVCMDKIFPEYQNFFCDMFGKTSSAILKTACSSDEINGMSKENLGKIMKKASRGKFNIGKAAELKKLASNSFSLCEDKKYISFIVKQMILQIELLENQIADLEEKIGEYFTSLNSKVTQIPGIGKVLGAAIVSEIGDIKRFSNSKKLTAFAGIDASVKQSGEFLSHENHMSKRGSSFLRRALWIAAFVNVNHNSEIMELYRRKMNSGKCHFKTMGYVCHKILNIVYTVLKNNSDYIPFMWKDDASRGISCCLTTC